MTEDSLVELARAVISAACWLAVVYWIGRPLALFAVDLAKFKLLPPPPPPRSFKTEGTRDGVARTSKVRP